MHVASLLPVVLSTASLANALPRRSAPATWSATNTSIGCSPGGCIASFNMKAPSSANSPGFNVYCEGAAPDHVACNNTGVTTTVKALGDSRYNVWVQHEWTIQPKNESVQLYFQAGNTNITDTDKTFRITPNEFYGVA